MKKKQIIIRLIASILIAGILGTNTLPVEAKTYTPHNRYNVRREAAQTGLYNFNIPRDISEGDYWRIYGTLTCSDKIDSVILEIQGNNQIMHVSDENVNAYSYDLAKLDEQVTFNTLEPGSYTYTVWIIAAGMPYTLIMTEFEVKAEDGEMTISKYRLPQYLSVGDVFYVKGIVKSKTPMSSVTVEIVAKDGKVMTGKTAYGHYTSYDLKNLDRYVEFDKVPAGEYRYIIKATNAYGEEILVDQSYLVR